MSGRLQNKTILITGGSRGIGAGIAKGAAAQGARVFLTYSSNAASAEQVLKSLPGSNHGLLQMNLTNPSSIDQAFETFFKASDRMDGLVNNAGVTKDQLLLRMKDEDFDEVIQTNLRGSFLCVKAAIKPMLKARAGSIVNITSVVGQTGNPGQSNYAASKAGLEAFSKSIAKEIGSRGIRVNCVAPGFIQTDMTDALNAAQKEAIMKNVPLERLGQVEDVAHAVVYLLSDESTYITGHTLSVNGGLHMSS